MTEQDLMPAMRLIGWCKNIDLACTQRFASIFRPPVMQVLQRDKLLKPYHSTYGWRLRPSGYRWLAERGFPVQPDQHTQRPGRRFENAAVAVTMYAAGISPFHDRVEDLRRGNCYLPASALRAKHGQHVLGSNQLVGILRLGKTLLAAHYPLAGAQQLVSLQREQDCLDALTLGAACPKEGLLFCGTDYASIHAALTIAVDREIGRHRKKTTYARFYETATADRYLLPCTRTGEMQLRVMGQADYRQRLTAMFGGEVQTMRAAELPDCDFFDSRRNRPGRILVDMELQGVERAAWQAKAAGYNQLVLAGLPQQVKFLRRIFSLPFFDCMEISETAAAILTGGDDDAQTF